MRYPQALLVSCEIPWNDSEELLEDVFRSEVRATLSKGFNHLYIFGTAGEGYAVTLSQFKQIVGIFHEEVDKPDVHPMVGIIGMSIVANVHPVTVRRGARKPDNWDTTEQQLRSAEKNSPRTRVNRY